MTSSNTTSGFTLYAACALLLGQIVLLPAAYAQDDVERCVMQQFNNGDAALTLAQIREKCAAISVQRNNFEPLAEAPPANEPSTGAISNRILREKMTEFQPYVITPHKMNYILPAFYTNAINTENYLIAGDTDSNLEDIEAKFQISLKVPLNTGRLLIEGDGLYLGFTLQAWWQIYSEGISKPFRETNYQPELFYLAPLPWHPFDGNTGFMLGIEHQSNGRSQILSRSWNRVYLNLLYEKDRFALSLRPWIRLAENEKQNALDPDGDDNPDIIDYMGHYELGMAYKWDNVTLGMTSRYNFATHNGFVEAGLTFPLWGKLIGYLTVSDGYGESLIDYNYNQTRYGLGIALTDIL